MELKKKTQTHDGESSRSTREQQAHSFPLAFLIQFFLSLAPAPRSLSNDGGLHGAGVVGFGTFKVETDLRGIWIWMIGEAAPGEG